MRVLLFFVCLLAGCGKIDVEIGEKTKIGDERGHSRIDGVITENAIYYGDLHLFLINKSPAAITEVSVSVANRSEGRSTDNFSGEASYEIPGGIEPGEEKECCFRVPFFKRADYKPIDSNGWILKIDSIAIAGKKRSVGIEKKIPEFK